MAGSIVGCFGGEAGRRESVMLWRGGVLAQPGLGGAWFPSHPPFLFCTSFVWWAQLSP